MTGIKKRVKATVFNFYVMESSYIILKYMEMCQVLEPWEGRPLGPHQLTPSIVTSYLFSFGLHLSPCSPKIFFRKKSCSIKSGNQCSCQNNSLFVTFCSHVFMI